MIWLAIVAFISFLLLYTYLGDKMRLKRLERLNSSRSSLRKEEYVERLASQGYSREEIEMVYNTV